MTIEVSFNGQRIACEPLTLQALLEQRGYDLTSAMACAIDCRFVPRAQWPVRSLCDGDRIDVIAPITGG